MTKPRVLISDSMSSLAVSVFEDRGVEVVSSSKLSPEELKDTIGDFEASALITLMFLPAPLAVLL